MIKTHLPELIIAMLMTVALLVGYSMRGTIPMRPPNDPVAPKVQARFLIQLEGLAPATVTISNEGQIKGGKRQQPLTQTEWIDLRDAVAKLQPDTSTSGPAKLRFYDNQGSHEVSFKPKAPPQSLSPLLEHLKVLEVY